MSDTLTKSELIDHVAAECGSLNCKEAEIVGGRGGFYTNARVKIGHWRHQMHTILAHSYPSVAS